MHFIGFIHSSEAITESLSNTGNITEDKCFQLHKYFFFVLSPNPIPSSSQSGISGLLSTGGRRRISSESDRGLCVPWASADVFYLPLSLACDLRQCFWCCMCLSTNYQDSLYSAQLQPSFNPVSAQVRTTRMKLKIIHDMHKGPNCSHLTAFGVPQHSETHPDSYRDNSLAKILARMSTHFSDMELTLRQPGELGFFPRSTVDTVA